MYECMNMYERAYVRMYVCMYVSMYVCVHAVQNLSSILSPIKYACSRYINLSAKIELSCL